MVRVHCCVKIWQVATVATCGCSTVTRSVTIRTNYRIVCTSEWKRGGIMVKNIITASTWMAFKASLTFIHITIYISMFIIHIRLIVLMTGDTTKLPKIIAVGVAVGAAFPFTIMLTGV